MDDRSKIIIKASWVGVAGNTFLSILKIVVGLLSGSLAVLADGIDSASDIVTSLITLFTARILSRPPDANYPYGYSKADTIATKALSFIILFAGAQLAITTVNGWISGNEKELPGYLAIYVTIFSIIGKFFLSVHQLRKGKESDSEMLKANAKNMQNDVIISGSVLLGLIITFIFKMPVLDSVTALLVSFWILRVGFQIFMQTNRDLMDGSSEPELYNKIFDLIETVEGASNPHRLRVRKIGNEIMVALDIQVEGDLSTRQSHDIACKIEELLKSKIDHIFDISIHIEPVGVHHHEKKYGVDRSDL